MGAELDVSVVIPAFNAERTVGRVVEALRSQEPAPAEIIVVDDGSPDRTGRSPRPPARGSSATTRPALRAAPGTRAGTPRRTRSSSSWTPTRSRRPAGGPGSSARSASFRARSSAARGPSTAARPGAGSPTSRARLRISRSESHARWRSSRRTASPSPATFPSGGTRATAARTASSAQTQRRPDSSSSSTRASTPTTTTTARPWADLRRQQRRTAYGIVRTRRVVDEGPVRGFFARVPVHHFALLRLPVIYRRLLTQPELRHRFLQDLPRLSSPSGRSGRARRATRSSRRPRRASPELASGEPAAHAAVIGDLTVRRLGLGTMALTGRGTWGDPPDPASARALLRRAAELGVQLFDTADSYGPEVAERLSVRRCTPMTGC